MINPGAYFGISNNKGYEPRRRTCGMRRNPLTGKVAWQPERRRSELSMRQPRDIARGMAARHERFCWDEAAIRRLVAAREDGVSAAELAGRFAVTRVTVERKLAELRADLPHDFQRYPMKPSGLG